MYKRITRAEIERIISNNGNVTFVDVSGTQKENCICTAFGKLPCINGRKEIKGLFHRDDLFVVVCTSRDCKKGHEMARSLHDRGIENIVEYHGQIDGYEEINTDL